MQQVACFVFELVFGLGPAGTGKSYLAVAKGIHMLKKGLVEKIILTRPAVEAGERLGFLPGDMKEKIDPYLRPIYDALYEMMPADRVEKKNSIWRNRNCAFGIYERKNVHKLFCHSR